MFGLFRRKKRAEDAPRIAALEAAVAALREEMLEERAKGFAFRGRVYAYLGRKGVRLKQDEEADDDFDPRTAPLDDPRLTKRQVKERLGLTTPAGIARHLSARG